MSTNIEILNQWLCYKGNEIEDVTRKEPTIMDIVGISRLENQWSKIYQFFLTLPSKNHPNHGFGDIFIRSLEKVLKDKGLGCEEGWLNNFDVFVEYPCASSQEETITYKRIDILLKNKQKAIIIENKVRHTLEGNDLKLYANTVLNEGCTDLKFVVLSLFNMEDDQIFKNKVQELNKLKNPENIIEYANITHVEYARAIEEQLALKSIEQSKYYDLYKDFFQNIMNQSNVMTDEEYDFFSKNYKKVKMVSDLYKKIIKSYKEELNKVFKENAYFNYKYLENDDNLFIQLSYKDRNDVLLSIFFDRLWKTDSPYITIILELQGDAKRRILSEESIIKLETEADNIKYHNDNGVELKKCDKNKWMHYASWDAHVEEVDVAPTEFARYLKQLINKDFSMFLLGKHLIDFLNSGK